MLWLLLKSLYGLRSAPRERWLTLYAALIDIGFVQSKQDPAMFIYRDINQNIIGIVSLHVDDMLAAGSEDFDEILEQCEKKFKVGSRGRQPRIRIYEYYNVPVSLHREVLFRCRLARTIRGVVAEYSRSVGRSSGRGDVGGGIHAM